MNKMVYVLLVAIVLLSAPRLPLAKADTITFDEILVQVPTIYANTGIWFGVITPWYIHSFIGASYYVSPPAVISCSNLTNLAAFIDYANDCDRYGNFSAESLYANPGVTDANNPGLTDWTFNIGFNIDTIHVQSLDSSVGAPMNTPIHISILYVNQSAYKNGYYPIPFQYHAVVIHSITIYGDNCTSVGVV